ncbi:hypothetical protein [Mesotoga sp.]|uniref:class I fructose-bisphosphate aldolase n=1 Tax=Mesotoga sp. TaxID=2053577 RepID=UPI001BD3D08A
MNGLKRRLNRLLAGESLVLAAADHGQFAGVPEGLEDIKSYVHEVEKLDVDGIILNPGIASLIDEFDCRKSLIVRVTHAGSALSGDIENTKYFLQPEEALRMGADGVIVMGIVGQKCDSDALHSLSRAIWEYRRYGIPVIAEMLPYKKEEYFSRKVIADISRIAAELGANIVKTNITSDYEYVIRSCPVPVIIAGGERSKDFFSSLEEAAAAGAAGAAIGRNLYLEQDKPSFIKRTREVLGRR